MPASNFGSNLIANYLTSGDLYLALTTSATVDTDTGSTIDEPTGASYSRVLLSSANWSAASAGECTYDTAIVYNPTEDWGSILGYAICQDSTAGEIVAYGALTSMVNIEASSYTQVPPGAIKIGVA